MYMYLTAISLLHLEPAACSRHLLPVQCPCLVHKVIDFSLMNHSLTILSSGIFRLGIIEKTGGGVWFLKGNTWGTHFKFGGYTKHSSAFHIPFELLSLQKKKESGFKTYFWRGHINTLCQCSDKWSYIYNICYLPNKTGSTPIKFKRLQLFHNILWQKDLLDSELTMGFIKVIQKKNQFIHLIFAEFQYQRSFPFPEARMAAWGLKVFNVTFVWLGIRSLLLKYIQLGNSTGSETCRGYG